MLTVWHNDYAKHVIAFDCVVTQVQYNLDCGDELLDIELSDPDEEYNYVESDSDGGNDDSFGELDEDEFLFI